MKPGKYSSIKAGISYVMILIKKICLPVASKRCMNPIDNFVGRENYCYVNTANSENVGRLPNRVGSFCPSK